VRILYFDCFAGISGDMILGALVDAGLSLEQLQAEMAKLKLSGFSIGAEKTMKNGFSGTRVQVDAPEGHVHRGLSDITEIIDRSDLNEKIKKQSKAAFTRLAEVEAGIHHKGINEIHFHEVGALDAIVDIVGAITGVHLLDIDAVHSSKVHLGTGFVKAAHGQIPVPAPATLALLKGVPTYSRGIENELTTPTGAAILTTLATSFGDMPPMTVEKIGYGVGGRDLPIPNMLRVCIGTADNDQYESDTVLLIETNLDNMNPEHFEYVTDRLRADGALDVYMTPIIMKKSRPATMLSVLVPPAVSDKILSIIFDETTTLGVRIQRIARKKLTREFITVQTKFGEVQVKIGKLGKEIKNIAAEYDDCKKIAAEQGIPIKDVYDEIKRAALATLS